MAMTDRDGHHVPTDVGDAIRAQIAYEVLRDLAGRWGGIITYGELAAQVEERSGITDTQRRQWWIGRVLDGAARIAAEREEPPLTALCVDATGRVRDGYLSAPKFAPASDSRDPESLAAEHRILCYRRFAHPDDAPARVRPVLPSAVQSAGRGDDWLEALLEVGHLTVHDAVPFKRHIDVARLFGRDYKGHQKATIRLGDDIVIWFPKMYGNADWRNSLEDDGATIRMAAEPGGLYRAEDKDPDGRHEVVTFGHVEEFGTRFYKFLGVFERDAEASTDAEWVYRLVSDTVYFDGRGAVDTRAVVRRGTLDDQAAEALPVDPALVEEFEAEIGRGDFSAPDVTGTSKLRGSAQRAFAQRVKDNYGWRCAVTGISTREFLVASHIVPWSEDETIRTDPTNGICLSTFVDRAFDTGFIWIDEHAVVRVRWDRVGDDPMLKLELGKLDEVALAEPRREPPDPDKLRRRIALGF